MKNKLKSNKAITLIALIITVIVMLILVGVTVSVVINSNLLGTAQSAVEQTKAEYEKEAEYGDKITVDGKRYANIDDYLNNVEMVCEQHEYGEKLTQEATCLESGKEYKVCKLCGHEEIISTMPALGHDLENGECTRCDYVEVLPEIGAYVYYNKSYTDAYQTNMTFTAEDGWRYLGKEAGTGNIMLISTGIPVKLYYSSTSAASWWDSSQTNANAKAAKGLATPAKFETITFEDGTTGAEFKEGSKAVGVRTLTLAELNATVNAVAGTSRAAGSTDEGFKDISGAANGLFDMKKIAGYTAIYCYWLASPYPSLSGSLYHVNNGYSNVSYVDNLTFGVRPVVLLSDIVFKAPTEGHTYWTFE